MEMYEDTQDFYDEVESILEDDEISPAEGAFVTGYLEAFTEA